MKKIFHPGMFAIIAIAAITVSSCSRSTNDLVVNEQSVKNNPVSASQGMNSIPAEYYIAGGSEFYTSITQPLELQLGLPNSYLPTGAFAVFYVLLSDEYANIPADDASLITRDGNTSDDIQSYNLISYKDADSYGLRIPEELKKRAFMFAIVELNDQYTDKAVSLYSEITVNTQTTVAQLDQAFTCSIGILAESN